MGSSDQRTGGKTSWDDGRELRELIRDMQVGVVLQGPRAEMRMGNPKALELLGLTEDQLLGRTSFDPMWNVIHEDGSPFPGVDHPVPRAIATGRPVRNTVMGVFRPPTADRVWLNVDAVPQQDPAGAVRQVVCTFTDITERVKAQEKIRNLLEEKDVILKEVHHRIKNNMGTVKALLVLQADTLRDSEAYGALKDAESRIQAMMILYDKLYRLDDFGRMSVRSYLASLVDDIAANFPRQGQVTIERDLEEFSLEAKSLQPLGIIVNELLTNTMKYAFPGRETGRIRVAAVRDGPRAVVTVEDDGVGIPGEVGFSSTAGFGLTLVDLMTKGLHGRVRIERGEGTRVIVEFPVVSSVP